MMWLFIVNDALLFAGFLTAYMFCRLSTADVVPWPDRAEVFSLNFITAMTFILITSSATMAMAVKASRFGDTRMATRMTLLTAIGGLVFLGMQVIEWTHFIGDGARLTSNPWGVPGFASYFFAMTGLHGTHVLIGVLILFLTARGSARDSDGADTVEVVGLYWHFVDLVWVFIFGCFYLL